MKIFLVVVIFAYLSTFVDSAPVGLSLSDELSCSIKYLKTLNKLEQSYPDNDSSAGSTDCEIFVNEQIDHFETEFSRKLRPQKEKYVDCLKNEFKKRGFYDEALLAVVHNNSAHMSEIDKNKKIAESAERASKIVNEGISWCEDDMMYSQQFDNLWKATTESDKSNKDREEFCIRKYVVDEGLISTNLFKVTLNPKNVSTEGLDCEESVKTGRNLIKIELEREFRKGFKFINSFKFIAGDGKEYEEKYTDCAMKAFDAMNISGKVMSILVLIELNLTVQQITEERKKYIEEQRQLTNAIIACGTT